jgi:hypothetical protein
MKEERKYQNLKQKTYSGSVVSKHSHVLQARMNDPGLTVEVPRKWVRLGFGAYDTLQRGDAVSIKYLGFDKVLSRDIFLVVPAIEDLSKEESPTKENGATHSFSYLLDRDRWKDEK